MRTLARPSREGITSALIAAGIAEPRAHALARDSARNLAVLRRLMPDGRGHQPKWAEAPLSRALLAALLAGGWNEDIAADRARLSELADQPYEEITAALTSYLSELDSPLQKVGSLWRIASPYDAWFLLARHLSSTEIQRFEATAYAVLGSADPRFDMDPDERWMAAVRGVRPEYSGMLRHGVGQTLILLAIWGIVFAQLLTQVGASTRSSAGCFGMRITDAGGRCLATSACWQRPRRVRSFLPLKTALIRVIPHCCPLWTRRGRRFRRRVPVRSDVGAGDAGVVA